MLLETNDYLTLKDSAAFLGVSRWTMYGFITRGKLSPGIKLPGGAHLFLRKDLEALKESDVLPHQRKKAKSR